MSSLMFHEVAFPPAQWKAVEKKAKHAGTTPSEYLQQLVKRDLLAEKSFDEILRPIRDDIRKSGITEDQLNALVDRARGPRRAKSRKSRP